MVKFFSEIVEWVVKVFLFGVCASILWVVLDVYWLKGAFYNASALSIVLSAAGTAGLAVATVMSLFFKFPKEI